MRSNGTIADVVSRWKQHGWLMLRLALVMLAIGLSLRSVPFDRPATASHGGQWHTTERVSINPLAGEGNGHSTSPAISANGRFVAFVSSASNLVSEDTNGVDDIFVHDRDLGTTIRVSVASDGTQANGPSAHPAISGDGRLVAFDSSATNLVARDTNGKTDVFLHDLTTGTTSRVGNGRGGAQPNGNSAYPSVNADGRFIAFQSLASNLVSGDTNQRSDVFVHDWQLRATSLVSLPSKSTQKANDHSFSPSISGDGRYVAFKSLATNLVSGDTNRWGDIFVRDRQLRNTTRVSIASDGTQANYESFWPSISSDGRFVAFETDASNLVPDDNALTHDAFVHELQSHATIRVSVSTEGLGGNATSQDVSISGDGRFVAFKSASTNLVPGDTNRDSDIFVHDLQSRTTERVNVSASGEQAYVGGESQSPMISTDGRFITFESWASNLIEGDSNGMKDIFVAERQQ